jgi:hypothetical protein
LSNDGHFVGVVSEAVWFNCAGWSFSGALFMSGLSEELPGTDCATNGLTVREHAAIMLRVPQSGSAWLDAMIRQSNRLELAKAAVRLPGVRYEQPDNLIDAAFAMADGMLSRLEQAEEPKPEFKSASLEEPKPETRGCVYDPSEGYSLIGDETPILPGDEIKNHHNHGWSILNSHWIGKRLDLIRASVRGAASEAIWQYPIRRRLSADRFYIWHGKGPSDCYLILRGDGTVMERRNSGYGSTYDSRDQTKFHAHVATGALIEVSREEAVSHMLKAEKE